MDVGGNYNLQRQIKENNEELSDFINELDQWQSDMKRKEQSLKKDKIDHQNVPPVRKSNIDVLDSHQSNNSFDSKKSRISSYDYAAWDKFDVEKACKDVEKSVKNANGKKKEEVESAAKMEIQEAVYHKEKGNECFKKAQYEKAIEFYTRGMKCDPKNAMLPANRAMCYLKINKFAESEMDCSSAINIDSTYVKAYLRRGTSRIKLRKFEEAVSDFHKVIELEPENRQAQIEIKQLNKMVNDSKKNEKRKDVTVATNSELTDRNESKKEFSTNKLANLIAKDSKEKKENTMKTKKKMDCESIASNRVIPIEKPPHLRSKKPLQRLFIEEICEQVESNTIQTLTETAVKKQEVEEKLSSANKHQKLKPIADNKGVSENVTSKRMNHTFIQPKTNFQFETTWKRLRSNEHDQFSYLKQINPEYLPEIFKLGMEIEPFTEVLHCLCSHLEYGENEHTILFLHWLTKIGRFRALSFFMTESDKKTLASFISDKTKVMKVSEDIISNLQSSYLL